ncbi:MAG: Fic family protein, partial [Candidatus Diapherotrites archaeon]|nr:Fic family protein [Candidatus Diapherotrites archaeon]
IFGKQYVLRKYIGPDKGMFSKEQFIANNSGLLAKEELRLREPLWRKSIKLAYNPGLIEIVEDKAIRLNNLIEQKHAENILSAEFAKEFIYNSNNIEGSRIPKEKLIELFENGKTSYTNNNEVIEVENSIEAFDYLKSEFSFNLASIKHLYHTLTKGLLLENKQSYPRGLRKVSILAGEATTSAPKNIQRELETLLKQNKENSKKAYPFQRAFDFHLRYETIHPFRDANGRTGRLIMNKILMQNNYPPIIIYKDNKKAYFNSLSTAQEGNNKKYYQFMLEQTQKTYDQMLNLLNK